MYKSKINKVILCFIVSIAMVFVFNMSAFASTVAHNDTYTYRGFSVPDEDLGGYITFYGYCHTVVNETYTKSPTQITATVHSVLAYVDSWNGSYFGYDAYCYAPYTMYYYNGSTQIGSQSLAYDSNILAGGDWACWWCNDSTSSKTFNYTNVIAQATSSFYCDDSINSYTQTTSATMN